MRLIEEVKPEWERVLRHTFVQGRDGRYYKIVTFQLYDKPPPPEFPNWEVNVEETDERGKRRVLIQPVLKRFFDMGVARDFHEKLLEGFDDFLHLQEPKKEEHKPAKAEAKDGGH